MRDPPQYNANSNFIAVLPVELLSKIFEISAKGQQTPFSQVMALSQVCILWRNVALSTPYLWSRLDFGYGNLETFAARSNPYPMQISVGRRCQLHRQFMDRDMSWLETHAKRIERLTIKGSRNLIRKITSSLGPGLPALRALHLHCELYHDGPIVVVETHLPNLRILDLTHVHTDLDALNNLSEIFLRFLRGSSGAAQIISLLRRCPPLQALHVCDIFEGLTADAGSAGDGECVELAHLECLELSYVSMLTLAQLLGHISIPTSAPMLRQCRNDETCLAPEDRTRICRICVFLEHGLPHLQLPNSDNHFKIILNENTDMSYPSLLRLTSTALDMSPVTSILLIAKLPISIIQFLQVLWPAENFLASALCPNLRHLTLRVTCNSGLPEQLGGSEGEDEIIEYLLVALRHQSRIGTLSLESLEINFGNDTVIEDLKGILSSVRHSA